MKKVKIILGLTLTMLLASANGSLYGQALKFAATALLMAGSLASCGNDALNNANPKSDVKGYVVGFHKCRDFEKNDGSIVFGLYILTEHKDSLLAYNIPHEMLDTLPELGIYKNLPNGSFPWGLGGIIEKPQIVFDYRKAAEHEIITISCHQYALFPMFNGENFKQIIITKINKEEIK